MSRTAHVVTKRIIEYGPGHFHGKLQSKIQDVFIAADVCVNETGDCTDDWEINTNDLRRYIEELRKLPPYEVHENFKDCDCIDKHTNKQILNILEEWVRYPEQDTGAEEFVRIEWF